MAKRVKKDMRGMVVFNSNLREKIKLNQEFTNEEIEFYSKKGLDFAFEDFCVECDKSEDVCKCGEEPKKTTPKKTTKKKRTTKKK